MKTYILQYRSNQGQWVNLTDDGDFAVEFVTLGAARFIAKEFAAADLIYPKYLSDWSVKDSTGVAHLVT